MKFLEPDLQIQGRPLQQMASWGHGEQPAWGLCSLGWGAFQSPSDPQGQLVVSQEHRNLATRETGIGHSGVLLIACREMGGSKTAGTRPSPPRILVLSTWQPGLSPHS